MSDLRETLRDLIENLSEENYDRSLAQYRFWLDIGAAYGHINKNQVENDAWTIRQPDYDTLPIHPTAHLFFRFVEDIEDHLTSRSASEYHRQSCASVVAWCFEQNLTLVKRPESSQPGWLLTKMNFIARWANLGFVEEAAIRNHILQSLISHPTLYDHQADALIILFKLAGATFGTYADPSVVDRCLQLLKGHYDCYSAKGGLIQVRMPRIVNSSIELRQIYRNWLSCGRVSGRASLPHQYSRPGSQNRLARPRKTTLQLPLSRPWDFPRETSSAKFFSYLHSNPSPNSCSPKNTIFSVSKHHYFLNFLS